MLEFDSTLKHYDKGILDMLIGAWLKRTVGFSWIFFCVAMLMLASCSEQNVPADESIVANSSISEMTIISKQYGIGDFNFADAVAWLSDSEIVIAGGCYNGGIFDMDRMDGFCVKVDSRGNAIWQETWGGPNQDNIRSILPLDSESSVMLGRYDEDRVGRDYPEVALWFLVVNSDGTIATEEVISRNGSLQGYASCFTSDGEIAVGGERSNQGVESFAFLMILNLNGQVLLEKEFSSSNSMSRVNSVIETSNGDYILAGSSGELFDFHGWARRIDPEGETVWYKDFPDLKSVSVFEANPDGRTILSTSLDDPQGIYLFEVDNSGELTGWEEMIAWYSKPSNALVSDSLCYFCARTLSGDTAELVYHLFCLDSELCLTDLGSIQTAISIGETSSCSIALSPDGHWLAAFGDGFSDSGQNQLVWLTTIPLTAQ